MATQEIVYITDLHYNVKNLGNAACLNMNGMTADARAQHMVDCMKEKFDRMRAEDPASELFLFLTGDLTSSEYNYQIFAPQHQNHQTDLRYDTNGDGKVDLDDFYFTEWDPLWLFKTKYLDQLTEYGIYVYCIPGNHDVYETEKWNELFGYGNQSNGADFDDPHIIAYNEADFEYVVRVNEDTAILLLNSYNEHRGAMMKEFQRNSGKSYLAGNQQTVGYTSSDLIAARALMEATVQSGCKSVYLVSHDVRGDAAILALCEEYDCIKALLRGDWHQDGILENYIGGRTLLVLGHFSGSGMPRPNAPKFDLDIKTLPHGYVTQKDGLFTYHKVENVYFGIDNLAFLSHYFELEKAEHFETSENTVGLTTYTTALNAKGVEIDVSPLSYYRYTPKKELSAEDMAIAARIQYFLDTYHIGVHRVYGDIAEERGVCYDYSSLAYQRYYLDESFYQPHVAYKSYQVKE